MQDAEDGRLQEVERLLNDPDVPIQPGRIWELLDEIAQQPFTPE